jgi:hypothetical protein
MSEEVRLNSSPRRVGKSDVSFCDDIVSVEERREGRVYFDVRSGCQSYQSPGAYARYCMSVWVVGAMFGK